MDSTEQYEQLKSLYTEEADLTHHGIKGMKWGVRRQNPSGAKFTPVTDPVSGAKFTIQHPDTVKIRKASNGSITVQGPKKERQKVIDEINRQRGEKQPESSAASKSGGSSDKPESSSTDKLDSTIRNKPVKDLSDAELQTLVQRLERETKVKTNRKADLDSELITDQFRKKSVNEMNTRDLEFYVRRMELEKKYGEINKKEKPLGKKFADKYIENEMGKLAKGEWESTTTWKVGAVLATAAVAASGAKGGGKHRKR